MGKIKTFLLTLIITVPAFASLLNNSYFSMHDDQQVARLYLLDLGLRQGSLYPRWVGLLGFNYGYPLFNFYPPLVYYLGEFFHLLGFSLAWSIKLVFIAGFILAAAGIYLFARKYVGRVFAYLSSLLYTYFFYHAVLIYVRGALAEYFSLSVLPFVFLTLDNLSRKGSLKNGLFFSLAWAALILNHPLIAFPALFYIGFFFLFRLLQINKDRFKFAINSILSFLFGLCISAFFWLPSMAERKFTLVDEILTRELANYKLHYIFPSQFFNSPWGYGGSIPGPYDGLTFQLGKVYIFLVLTAILLGIFYFIKNRGRIEKSFRSFIFFAALLLVSLFMTTDYSGFIWDNVRYLWYLQFPWRFLIFVCFFISIVGAYSTHYFFLIIRKEKLATVKILLTIIISIATVFIYQKYFKPQRLIQITDSEKTSFEEIAWQVSRSSFEFVPKGVVTKKSELNTTILAIDPQNIPKEPFKIISGRANIKVIKNKFIDKEFKTQTPIPTTFRLNTFNFPGWAAYVDGNKTEITDNNNLKLITVTISQGEHDLLFKFEDTPARKLGNAISLLSIAFGGLFIFIKPKKVY